jgi:hypothetical protein
MTQQGNTQVATSPPASTGPASGSSPTVTHHEQVASGIIGTIVGGMALMPDLLVAHPVKAKYLRTRQRFYTPDLITSSAVSVESDTELQGVPSLDAATARDRLQYIEAYSALEDVLKRALGNVSFTLQSKKWEATLQALKTYGMAKTLVRDPNSTLAAHVVKMGKVIQHMRRPRKVAAPPATPSSPPTPSSPAPTTPPSHTVPQLPQATASTAT